MRALRERASLRGRQARLGCAGPLPDAWQTLPSLAVVDLSNNTLSGARPARLSSQGAPRCRACGCSAPAGRARWADARSVAAGLPSRACIMPAQPGKADARARRCKPCRV